MPSECMRILLLRRLWRCCNCGGALDVWGDYRTACPIAGVLGSRGAPLERAAARRTREAGARVANNFLLRDMNLNVPLADALANGLGRHHEGEPNLSESHGMAWLEQRQIASQARPRLGGSAKTPTRSSWQPAAASWSSLGWRWAGGGNGHVPPSARRCPRSCGPHALETRHVPS